MVGTSQRHIRPVFSAVIFATLVCLVAEGFSEIGAKGKPVLHIWRKDSGDISLHASFAGRETTENPLKRTYFHPLGKQPLPEGSKALLFPVATWDEHYYKPSSRGNTESESINADPEAFGASLSPETAQAFSLPFAQDLQKEAIKRKDTALYPEVAAVLTPARYSAALQWSISKQLRSNPRGTPIIRARWHTAEQYVAAAAALRDDRWKPFFFVVLAEYAPVKNQNSSQFLGERDFALVPATQESLTDENGEPLSYPFSLPTPLQLLQSAFGDEYAVKVLANGQLSSATQSLSGSASGQAGRDATAAGSPGPPPPSEPYQMREASSAFLRWIPFGLTRKPSASEVVGELPVRSPGGEASLLESPENEEAFIEALSKSLPRRWLKAPDGRRLVIVLNDQITECRGLLHLAVNSSAGGTPVFVENSGGLDPRKLLMRLKDERIRGKKIAFLLFALGGSETMPMNTAFLDRTVLRVPKLHDIKSFLEQKEKEAAEDLASDKEELEEMKHHMERRRAHLLELEGKRKAAKLDETHINFPQKDSGKSGQIEAYKLRKIGQPPVFVLNQFDEYLLRFNYTEVSDLTSYAETLALELKNEPLEISIAGETHRVAVMILSEPPETETELGPAWASLNKLIHMAITISMIVALLCCLCMWRLMLLLKQR